MKLSEIEEDRLLKNTIKKERVQVFNIVRRLGLRLSGLMVACGVIILGLGVEVLLVPPDPNLSPRLNLIFTAALAFIGGLNILCGMLLLLGED